MTSKNESKREIKKLIDKYTDLTDKQKKAYNEANTRKDFIMPLFHALGWDVYNSEIHNEVIEEEVSISKRIDYSFRLNNITQFILEAKAIPEDLNKEQWAQQAIEYGWNKGIPWVILTDFEGLKVFNSEWKKEHPQPNIDLSYKDYIDKFDKLWLLSKDSVQKNELDSKASEWGITAKRESVNERLAKDLLDWREELTDRFSKWNKETNKEIIEESVQKILDRLIFIRVVEDRNLEEKVLWQEFQKWKKNNNEPQNFIKVLVPLFRKFDKQYNSNLFQQHICEQLYTTQEPFQIIIPGLYGQKEEGVKYRFDAINADVLGNVYEQYLGYVQGREGAKSKRKKEGIYYTPTYIVDYIVQNTLGKLLEEKNLVEIENLKVLDPACGSGSFLIKSFDVLNEKIKKMRNQKGNIHAPFRKHNILVSNIHGVDLDPKAVEIARLNLILKALEPNLKLPLLSNNIKNGNSLIEDEKVDKKAFAWKDEFSEIMETGGFDVIIGNPPYVNSRNLKTEDKQYYTKKYSTAEDQYDLYSLFIEKSLKILKKDGYLGFIVPNKFLVTKYGIAIRKCIIENSKLVGFLDYSEQNVFEDASVYPVVIILKKTTPKKELVDKEADLLEKYGFKKSDSILERMENKANYVKLKVWRPLATAADILKGKKIIVTNREVHKYQIDKNKKGKLPNSRIKDSSKNKIIMKKLCFDLEAALDSSGYQTVNTVYCIQPLSSEIDTRYILGVLNSQLMTYYARNKFSKTALRGGYIELRVYQVETLPIISANPSDQKVIVELVNNIISLQKEMGKTKKNSDSWDKMNRKTKRVTKKIDRKVYKLYNLTPKEIEIVEKS